MKTIPIVAVLLLLSAPVLAQPQIGAALLYAGSVNYAGVATVQLLPDSVFRVDADLLVRPTEDGTAWAGGLSTPLTTLPDKLGAKLTPEAHALLERMAVGALVDVNKSAALHRLDVGFYAKWTALTLQW